MVVAAFVIGLSCKFLDDGSCRIEAEVRKVCGVGTHVCDETRFVKGLCHAHGKRNGESEFVCRFLLQCGGGEGWSGETFCGTFLYAFHGEGCPLALFQESFGLCSIAEVGGQHRLHGCRLSVGIGDGEACGDAVTAFAFEILDFAFAFHDEPYGDTLYAACREIGLHLPPKYRAELETYQAVEHAACLLGIHQVEVDGPRVLDGGEDGGLRDFVEDNAPCIGGVEVEYLCQVPADGLSFAVFIGCQPYGIALLCFGAEALHYVALVSGDFVFGGKGFKVNAEISLLQVADMSET